MAAGYFYIYFSNAQRLAIYTNASVINAPLHVTLNGPASSTAPYQFSVNSRTVIDDIVTEDTNCTAGEVEIFANGQRTGKKFALDQRWLFSVDRRKAVPRIGFRPGVLYELRPTIQTS